MTPSNEVGRASGRNDKEQAEPGQGADEEDGDVDGLHCDKDELAAIDAELARPRNVVAYNGSVIERYPAYRERLTMCLDALVSAVGGPEGAALDLVEARESSVIGAAVALACLDDTDKAVAATS